MTRYRHRETGEIVEAEFKYHTPTGQWAFWVNSAIGIPEGTFHAQYEPVKEDE